MVEKVFYGVSIVGHFFKFWLKYEWSKNQPIGAKISVDRKKIKKEIIQNEVYDRHGNM